MSTSENIEVAETGRRQPKRHPGAIGQLVRSSSFVEKVALLLITTLITSVLVPLGVNYLEARSAAKTKFVESTRARQAAITEAQSALLNNFSRTLLTYQTMALDVSYYGTAAYNDSDMQQKAYERYSERLPELFIDWRTDASRARTLASDGISDKMTTFLDHVLLKQDAPMTKMIKNDVTDKQWEEQHRINISFLQTADRFIGELASDMGLINSN